MAAGIFGGGGLIGDALAPYALISSPLRRISYLIPDVVVEELGTEDLAVTDHPVETGAAISDHAFKLPSRVEMRCGWSNSSAAVEGFVQQITEALDTLQAKREPFTVYTGKKVYQNMLLGRIAIETNAESENSLMAVLGLRGVLITSTQMIGATQANQAMPEKTGSVSEQGTVTPAYTSNGFNPGSNTTYLGDGSLGIGPATQLGSVGDRQVDGLGAFSNGLPDNVATITPGSLGGNVGLFGSYAPNVFANVQPFRI